MDHAKQLQHLVPLSEHEVQTQESREHRQLLVCTQPQELKLLDLEREYVDEFTKHYRPIFMDVLSKNGYKPQIITGETLNTPIKKENKISVDENELKECDETYNALSL